MAWGAGRGDQPPLLRMAHRFSRSTRRGSPRAVALSLACGADRRGLAGATHVPGPIWRGCYAATEDFNRHDRDRLRRSRRSRGYGGGRRQRSPLACYIPQRPPPAPFPRGKGRRSPGERRRTPRPPTPNHRTRPARQQMTTTDIATRVYNHAFKLDPIIPQPARHGRLQAPHAAGRSGRSSRAYR